MTCWRATLRWWYKVQLARVLSLSRQLSILSLITHLVCTQLDREGLFHSLGGNRKYQAIRFAWLLDLVGVVGMACHAVRLARPLRFG
ncbi:hypothetical protein B0T10DRAFT_477109 [Thelonectria olida]|uniref:Uncharacterized protein n=1 Tax=Thelonectria olida TaxID=1576542 RepID=A0A9P8W9Q1_9HYPO|nr:hypothetical protein B0T10DRAFT_477109 [Thelonectria olida]